MTRHPTKLVIHNLPILLTNDEFNQLLLPIQPYVNWSYYQPGRQRNTATSTRLSTGYINVSNVENVYTVLKLLQSIEQFNTNNVSIDYCIYQQIPRKKSQSDPLVDTYRSDSVYHEFIQSIEQKHDILPSAEKQLEQRTGDKLSSAATPTINRHAAIIDYMIDTLKQNKQNKQASKRDNNKSVINNKIVAIDENDLYDDNDAAATNNKNNQVSNCNKSNKTKAVLLTDEKQAHKIRKQQKRIQQRLKKLQQKQHTVNHIQDDNTISNDKPSPTSNTTAGEKKQYKIKSNKVDSTASSNNNNTVSAASSNKNTVESKPTQRKSKQKSQNNSNGNKNTSTPTAVNNDATSKPNTTTPKQKKTRNRNYKSKPVAQFVAKQKSGSTDTNNT